MSAETRRIIAEIQAKITELTAHLEDTASAVEPAPVGLTTTC